MEGVTRKSGFSIIELMVAMLAVAIMSAAVGLILSQGWKVWYDTNETVEMERDLSLAVKVISREIRCSIIDDITTSADRIDFAVGGTRTQAEYIAKVGNDIVHDGPDGSFTLVRGTAKRMDAVKNANVVVVSLEQETAEGFTEDVIFKVYARNKP